jgi:DNA-binding transcriptional ArsR family regulator
VSDSGSEEETYSLMFSSLRHPARRKILRMLSDNTMTFSKMLEELAIPSSHLTYHLENLGELVLKDKDGKYELSSFGKASVAMMKGAEEVPNGKSNRFSTLPLRWKSMVAAFAIAIVVLAGFASVQFASVNSLNSNFASLQADYNKVQAENQRLLKWTPSTNFAMVIIKDVIQINVSMYQATLESNTAQIRTDYGGAIEEAMSYKLSNIQSAFELTLIFENGHLSLFTLTQLEGYPNYPPIYTQPQSTDPLQATRDLIARYQSVANDSYLGDVSSLLTIANETTADQFLGTVKLDLSNTGSTATATMTYTENGFDYLPKSIQLSFDKNVMTKFSDNWFLFNVGSTQINVTQDQAVAIAKNEAKSFSWNVNGTRVANFQILDNLVSVVFWAHPRGTDDLTLYPYWYVTLFLDKTYPGGVSALGVGVWADTGKVEAVTT